MVDLVFISFNNDIFNINTQEIHPYWRKQTLNFIPNSFLGVNKI